MTEPQIHLFKDDGIIPNHSTLPIVYYHNAVELKGTDNAAVFERLFYNNNWEGSWRNGVYPFPHYHAAAHEVLGVYSGTGQIRLGGSNGIITKVQPGDVIIIPAGVGHENLGASIDFGVVGAYPPGQIPDVQHGDPKERKWVLDAIDSVPLPISDPVFGATGPLLSHWQ